MYKSGRKWVVAGLTAVSLLTATGAVAHADNDANQVPVANENVNTPQSTTGATSQATSDSSQAPNSNNSQTPSSNSSQAPSSAAQSTQTAAPQTSTTAAYAAQTDTQQSQGVDLNSLHFSNNAHSQQFIESVAPGAINTWNEYQILPSVTVAQAILESGWGNSTLTTRAHNLFGIKGSYNGHYVTMPTGEYFGGRYVTINDNFRAYPNNSASIEDHGRFLTVNSRYSNLRGDTNYISVTNKLRADGYATAPNYATALQNLIRTYNLTQLDTVALSGHVVVNKQPNDNSSSSYGNSTNYYTVQSGDTLSGIANRFSTTVNTLAHLNDIQNVNRIYVGQHLLVRQAQAPTPSQPTNQNQNQQPTQPVQPTTPSQPTQPVTPSQPTNTTNVQSSYTVKSGDTLSGIANHFGTSYVQLAQINHIANPNRIYVGQVLQLKSTGSQTNNRPAATTPTTPLHHNTSSSASAAATTGSYTVKSGDTLSGIASRFGVSYEQLAQSNGIANPNRIYVGQVIRLGGTTASRPATNYSSSRTAAYRGGYTVKSGNTLSGIAAQYGLNWYSLAQRNGLAAPYTIYVGQRLAL